MKKYSIISEIRKSDKEDFYLSYTILRDGCKCEDMRLPNKIINLMCEIKPFCSCGTNYGYSNTIEEIQIRKEKFDLIISNVYPKKEINPTPDKDFNIIESYVFA
jgi:hypothetical protein